MDAHFATDGSHVAPGGAGEPQYMREQRLFAQQEASAAALLGQFGPGTGDFCQDAFAAGAVGLSMPADWNGHKQHKSSRGKSKGKGRGGQRKGHSDAGAAFPDMDQGGGDGIRDFKVGDHWQFGDANQQFGVSAHQWASETTDDGQQGDAEASPGQRKGVSRRRRSERPNHPFNGRQVRLNAKICQVSEKGSVWQLLDLAETHKAEMNFVNMSTALNRIARLAKRSQSVGAVTSMPKFQALKRHIDAELASQEERFTKTWLQMSNSQPELDENSTRRCCTTIAWSYATLQLRDVHVFMRIANLSTLVQLDQFKSFEIANLLWAFAKLRIQSNPFLEAVVRSVQGQLSSFSAVSLATLAWAFATLQRKPGTAFLRSICKAFMAHLETAGSQEIANMAWALATSREQVSDFNFFEGLGHAAAGKLDTFNIQELANTAWAFSRAGIRHPELFNAYGELFKNNPRLPDQFHAQGLANLMWALAKQSSFDGDFMKGVMLACKLLPACQRALDNLKPQELSSILWSCAKLGIKSGFMQEADSLFWAVAQLPPDRISGFSMQGITNVLYAFTEFLTARIGPYCNFLTLLTRFVYEGISQFEPIGLLYVFETTQVLVRVQQASLTANSVGKGGKNQVATIPDLDRLSEAIADTIAVNIHCFNEAAICRLAMASTQLRPVVRKQLAANIAAHLLTRSLEGFKSRDLIKLSDMCDREVQGEMPFVQKLQAVAAGATAPVGGKGGGSKGRGKGSHAAKGKAGKQPVSTPMPMPYSGDQSMRGDHPSMPSRCGTHATGYDVRDDMFEGKAGKQPGSTPMPMPYGGDQSMRGDHPSMPSRCGIHATGYDVRDDMFEGKAGKQPVSTPMAMPYSGDQSMRGDHPSMPSRRGIHATGYDAREEMFGGAAWEDEEAMYDPGPPPQGHSPPSSNGFGKGCGANEFGSPQGNWQCQQPNGSSAYRNLGPIPMYDQDEPTSLQPPWSQPDGLHLNEGLGNKGNSSTYHHLGKAGKQSMQQMMQLPPYPGFGDSRGNTPGSFLQEDEVGASHFLRQGLPTYPGDGSAAAGIVSDSSYLYASQGKAGKQSMPMPMHMPMPSMPHSRVAESSHAACASSLPIDVPYRRDETPGALFEDEARQNFSFIERGHRALPKYSSDTGACLGRMGMKDTSAGAGDEPLSPHQFASQAAFLSQRLGFDNPVEGAASGLHLGGYFQDPASAPLQPRQGGAAEQFYQQRPPRPPHGLQQSQVQESVPEQQAQWQPAASDVSKERPNFKMQAAARLQLLKQKQLVAQVPPTISETPGFQDDSDSEPEQGYEARIETMEFVGGQLSTALKDLPRPMQQLVAAQQMQKEQAYLCEVVNGMPNGLTMSEMPTQSAYPV